MESFRLIRKLTRVEGREERMKGVADELEAQEISDMMTLLSCLDCDCVTHPSRNPSGQLKNIVRN